MTNRVTYSRPGVRLARRNGEYFLEQTRIFTEWAPIPYSDWRRFLPERLINILPIVPDYEKVSETVTVVGSDPVHDYDNSQ